MAKRTKATLQSRWWKNFFSSIQKCYACGGTLQRRFVEVEQTRRHVCIRCSTITYLNPKVVAGLIPLMPDGRVVLLKRNIEPAKGLWSYPAGFMELGETVEQAALRESREEIGVRASISRMIGIYSYADAGVVTIVFVGKVNRGQIPKPMPESEEVRLFKPSEIPWNKLAFRNVEDALKDWICQPH